MHAFTLAVSHVYGNISKELWLFTLAVDDCPLKVTSRTCQTCGDGEAHHRPGHLTLHHVSPLKSAAAVAGLRQGAILKTEMTFVMAK